MTADERVRLQKMIDNYDETADKIERALETLDYTQRVPSGFVEEILVVRPEPLEERRKRLAKLLSRDNKALRDGIQLSEAITGDGAAIFRHA
jgi:ribosome recycling factor